MVAIITFSGVDGIGKTSHVRATTSFLKKNAIDVVYVHMINQSTSFAIGKYLGKVSPTFTDGIVKMHYNRKRNMRSEIIAFLREILSLMDLFLFYFRVIIPARIKGKVIICDRYFYDALVHLTYFNIAGRFFSEIYRSLIPAPDIAILLDAEPNIPHNRKPEHFLEYIIEKRKLYLELASKEPLIVIKSTNFKNVQDDIEKKISKVIVKVKICKKNN